MRHALAAFIGQHRHQRLEEIVVGREEENPAPAALADQPGAGEKEDVVLQRRGGNGKMGLERADAEPVGAGAHQQADDLEADRIAQLVETVGGMIEFHVLNLGPARPIVNDNSRIIEL